MPILRSKKEDSKKIKSKPVERSVYASDVKIDKAGVQWKKKSVWFRQEHLSKLKVIAHFENNTIPNLIDNALEEYVKNKLENSMAIRKLVSQSAGKVIKGRT